MVEGNHCIGICHHLRNLVRREEPRMTEHLENIDSRWCGRDAGPLSYIRCWTFSTNTGWWDSCLLKTTMRPIHSLNFLRFHTPNIRPSVHSRKRQTRPVKQMLSFIHLFPSLLFHPFISFFDVETSCFLWMYCSSMAPWPSTHSSSPSLDFSSRLQFSSAIPCRLSPSQYSFWI